MRNALAVPIQRRAGRMPRSAKRRWASTRPAWSRPGACWKCWALALDVPPNFFGSRHAGQNVTLRFLHYPANLAPRDSQLGAGAHTDYGSITLVFQQDVEAWRSAA